MTTIDRLRGEYTAAIDGWDGTAAGHDRIGVAHYAYIEAVRAERLRIIAEGWATISAD